MHWGKALERMEELGISQYQLSIDLGKDKSQVKKWIQRDNIPPGDCLIKMSKILNVRPEWFFPEEFPNIANESNLRRKFHNWVDDMTEDEMRAIRHLFKVMGAYGERLEE